VIKSRKLSHLSYQQLLGNVPKIKHCFEVEFLTLPGDKFGLLRFSKDVVAGGPLLVIMAGCHGEEPAPPLAIFKNYKLIAEAGERCRVNLVIYPLVNPWGFDRNERLNRQGFNCNSNWVHEEAKRPAREVEVISKDMRNLRPLVFVSLHEDDETEREFYIFSFGNRKYEKPLIEVGKKYFPILKDGEHVNLVVKNGSVYDHHDGSAEDFMSHRGCEFSCCTETPSSQSLSRRIECNTELTLELIKLSS